MPKTKKRTRTFTVTLDLPEGLTVKETAIYIREAVETHAGGKDPEDPVYAIATDRPTVRVKVVPPAN